MLKRVRERQNCASVVSSGALHWQLLLLGEGRQAPSGCCGQALRCHERRAVRRSLVGVHAFQLDSVSRDGVALVGGLAAECDLQIAQQNIRSVPEQDMIPGFNELVGLYNPFSRAGGYIPTWRHGQAIR